MRRADACLPKTLVALASLRPFGRDAILHASRRPPERRGQRSVSVRRGPHARQRVGPINSRRPHLSPGPSPRINDMASANTGLVRSNRSDLSARMLLANHCRSSVRFRARSPMRPDAFGGKPSPRAIASSPCGVSCSGPAATRPSPLRANPTRRADGVSALPTRVRKRPLATMDSPHRSGAIRAVVRGQHAKPSGRFHIRRRPQSRIPGTRSCSSTEVKGSHAARVSSRSAASRTTAAAKVASRPPISILLRTSLSTRGKPSGGGWVGLAQAGENAAPVAQSGAQRPASVPCLTLCRSRRRITTPLCATADDPVASVAANARSSPRWAKRV